MRKANVWVLSPFSNPSIQESADRYLYICQELSKRGVKVCQFVSTFDHGEKRRRNYKLPPWQSVGVFEPGYRKNVSIRRVLSHIVFDLLILFYFIREAIRGGIPDTILTAMPHNGAACVAAIFAKGFRVKLIVDVHDTWPESILSVTKLNIFTRSVYRLWKGIADFVLLCADEVFAESVRYAERANAIRDRFGLSRATPIYLGGDLGYYRRIYPPEILPEEVQGASFILAYAGTLGENYDFDCVINAFVAFIKECPEAGLVLLGGGERETSLRSRLSTLGLKAWVSGRISHPMLLGYLKASRVGLNCFKAGGNVAYSYKLNDYLLSGLPVVNSLVGESAELISTHDLGVNYRAGDQNSLLDALRICYLKWRENPDWSQKVLSFSAEFLNRQESYRTLLQRCLERA